jgi:hypothetical protein
MLAAAATTSMAASEVMISQVYAGGRFSSSRYEADFVELYNSSSTTTVTVNGWSVQYAGAAASSVSDVAPLFGQIKPRGFMLVQMSSASNGLFPLNDGTNYPYYLGDITASPAVDMNETDGMVFLVNNSTALGTNFNSASIVDMVGYGTAGHYEGTGPVVAAAGDHGSAFQRVTWDTDQNASDWIYRPFTSGREASNSAVPSDTIAVPVQVSAFSIE